MLQIIIVAISLITLNTKLSSSATDRTSVFLAATILVCWAILLCVNLFLVVEYWYLRFPLLLLQAYLFTGLFIIAHDAMHGNIHSDKRVNDWIGQICLWLYAAFSFSALWHKHKMHHAKVGTKDDPDYSQHGFWRWYFGFMGPYLSWKQLLLMALVFNILHWIFGVEQLKLILYWIVPSFLSTLQLFYFGTYRPHRNAEKINNIHKSRSIPKNHFLALLSCYFFGYHFQHHSKPRIPWWKLWTAV